MKKTIVVCLLFLFTVSLVLSACGTEGNKNEISGRDVRVGDKIISLDEDIESVKGKIGEAESEESAVSCLYEGYDRVFYYDGFYINTYPNGEKDYVSSIVVSSSDCEVFTGVKVGDTLEVAKEKTGGTLPRESEFFCTYDYETYGITYYLADSLIKEIEVFKVN